MGGARAGRTVNLPDLGASRGHGINSRWTGTEARQVRQLHPALVGTLACSLLVLLFLARAVALDKCVKVRVTNCFGHSVSVAYGPVTLCAETRVTPDANHRYLETVWDYAPADMQPQMDQGSMSDDVQDSEPFMNTEQPDKQDGAVGSSLRSLNGADERVTHSVKMHHLEGGAYLVQSIVYTDESRKKVCGRATTRVTIH
jgi:hypothetical protein